jgi:hypothetical protein
MSDHLDAICAEYLARVEADLAGVPARERRQIVEQISEHISTARAALPEQSEDALREILRRLGPPEDIAATARRENFSGARRERSAASLAVAVAVGVVGLGIGLAAALGTFSGIVSSSLGTNVKSDNSTHASPVRGSPIAVSVPLVIGEQLSRAVPELTDVGLEYRVIQTTGTVPIGTVIMQAPAGGSAAQVGTPVQLTVVGMAIAVGVPNVVGKSQAQAAAVLAARGLVMSVTGSAANDQVAAGIVTSQEPPAGASVPSQSDVSVTLSAG